MAPSKWSSWFRRRPKGGAQAGQHAEKPPAGAQHAEPPKMDAKAWKSLDDFIIRGRKVRGNVTIDTTPEGHYVKMTGGAFAQRNERLMGKRAACLQKVGVAPKKAEEILYLYRIRKAASEISDCRGFITEEAAVALLSFLAENRAKFGQFMNEEKGFLSKKAPQLGSGAEDKLLENSIKSLEHALRAPPGESSREIGSLSEHQIDTIRRADYALYPADSNRSRILLGNFFLMSTLPFHFSSWLINKALGEKAGTFNGLIDAERKKIGEF